MGGMTNAPEPQPAELPRLVVQVSDPDNKPRKRARRVRKNLHEPCPGQLSLLDLPSSEDQP